MTAVCFFSFHFLSFLSSRALLFHSICSMLADKLNMTPEEAERWIVNLIRNARLDAKIDSKLVRGSLLIFIYAVKFSWVLRNFVACSTSPSEHFPCLILTFISRGTWAQSANNYFAQVAQWKVPTQTYSSTKAGKLYYYGLSECYNKPTMGRALCNLLNHTAL